MLGRLNGALADGEGGRLFIVILAAWVFAGVE